jgi:hypothetical protein
MIEKQYQRLTPVRLKSKWVSPQNQSRDRKAYQRLFAGKAKSKRISFAQANGYLRKEGKWVSLQTSKGYLRKNNPTI